MLEVPRDHPSEGEHVDISGSGGNQREGERPHRGAGRIDIVDNEHVPAGDQPPSAGGDLKGAPHIAVALAEAEPDLLAGVAMPLDTAGGQSARRRA